MQFAESIVMTSRLDELRPRRRARTVWPPTAVLVGWVAGVVFACHTGETHKPPTPAPGPPPATAPANPSVGSPNAPGAPPAPSPGPPAAPRGEDVATVVEYLLTRIGESGLIFIRNGSEHTAAEAAAHIRDKYEHFKSSIKTPEDFIDKAATKSMLTGKPYLVKMPDGTTRPAADWLREVLAEYRAKRPEPA